jgi:hypothetical protein
MASYLRMMLGFAAMTGIAALLSAAAPAVAAESTVSEVGGAAKTAPAVKRVGSRRTSAMRGNLDCSGAWCGKQFVLMLGVGY